MSNQNEYYTIGEERLAEILAAYVEVTGDAAMPAWRLRAYLLADWPEGDEHQEWLNEAPAGEVARWVFDTAPWSDA